MRGRDGMRREVTSEGDVAAPSYVREVREGGRDRFLQWAVTRLVKWAGRVIFRSHGFDSALIM